MKYLRKDQAESFIKMWNSGIDLFIEKVVDIHDEKEVRLIANDVFENVLDYFNMPVSILNFGVIIDMRVNSCTIMSANEALEAYKKLGGQILGQGANQ